MTLSLKLSTIITWAAILIMGQLLITQWSIAVAGNREVIDYISFAGTVVGMILAILAIVYSYLANASQRSDAEALRSQISSLNDAIGRAQASSSQFSNEVNRLEDIREDISKSVANSAAALEASGRVEAEIKSLRGDVTKPQPTRTSESKPTNLIGVVIKIAREATNRQLILYYLAAIDDEDGAEHLKDELLGKLTASAKSPVRKTWFEGEIRGYYWIFYDLEIIQQGEKRTAFLKALQSKISSARGYDSWAEEREPIKDCIAIVEKRLKDRLNTMLKSPPA